MNPFKINDVVIFNGNSPFKMAAQKGAMARVMGVGDGWISVEWMASTLLNGQNNGQFPIDMFTAAPVESQTPWFSFKITREVLRREVFLRGYPAVALQLHSNLEQLINRIMTMEEPKVEDIKQLPAPDDKA